MSANTPLNLKALQQFAHAQSRKSGFYDGYGPPLSPTGRNVPEMLCLIHSEISEALEDYRSMTRAFGEEARLDTMPTDENGKPVGFAVELADAIIRIVDVAEYLNIDLEAAVLAKMAYNATRPYKHGRRC